MSVARTTRAERRKRDTRKQESPDQLYENLRWSQGPRLPDGDSITGWSGIYVLEPTVFSWSRLRPRLTSDLGLCGGNCPDCPPRDQA